VRLGLTLTGFSGCCLATLASLAIAQVVPPDAGRVLQDTRPVPAPTPTQPLPAIQAPTQPRLSAPSGSEDVRVKVTDFSFTGNSALSSAELDAAVAEWTGKSLNFGDLIQAVEAIEARYKLSGNFLAQAYLPPQKIKDGTIEIAIAEGTLGETRLERQVLLINELAGGRATLDMQAGDTPGTTDIVLAQTTEDLLGGRVELNNHGSPSPGIKRISVSLTGNSPLKLGDRFNASANGDWTDDLLGGGAKRVDLTLGKADLNLGATAAVQDTNGTNGRFHKTTLVVSRQRATASDCRCL
jgi:hemolysin activation/secretion protein